MIIVAGDHPAEHEHVAVREVDQLEDAVDERVAERDERVDGAVREPDERDREEVRRALDEVHAEPEDEQPDEERRDERHHVGARPSVSGGARAFGAERGWPQDVRCRYDAGGGMRLPRRHALLLVLR